MKKFLTLSFFFLVSFAFVAAQGNGNGNSNGSSNGPSIQVGTNISWQTAHRVLQKARIQLQGIGGPNFGQLLSQYIQGNVTITLVSSNPPTSTTFRVTLLSGGDIIVVLDE